MVIAVPPFPSNLPTSEEESKSLAIENNPDVVLADFTERAARSDIDLTRGELLPTVTLGGELNREEDVLGRDVKETETGPGGKA